MLPVGLHSSSASMSIKLGKHAADATGVSLSPAGPPGSCPLHFLHLTNLSFMIGMTNRCCILKLRANQCFVCSSLVCLGGKVQGIYI